MNTQSKILNPKIAHLSTGLGHFEAVCIADAGLPLEAVKEDKITDVSVVNGTPSFEAVFRVFFGETAIEQVILAEEIKSNNLVLDRLINELCKERKIPVEYVSHEALKQKLPEVKGVIRTGECTPYANVILIGGVHFSK